MDRKKQIMSRLSELKEKFKVESLNDLRKPPILEVTTQKQQDRDRVQRVSKLVRDTKRLKLKQASLNLNKAHAKPSENDYVDEEKFLSNVDRLYSGEYLDTSVDDFEEDHDGFASVPRNAELKIAQLDMNNALLHQKPVTKLDKVDDTLSRVSQFLSPAKNFNG